MNTVESLLYDTTIHEWINSDSTKIDPSFIAHVLLLTTRSSTGLSDLTKVVKEAWEDKYHREKCVELLTQVAQHSRSYMDAETVQTLMTFITDHLADISSVPRLVDLAMILCSTSHFNRKNAIFLCQSYSNNVFVRNGNKKHQNGLRYKLLVLLKTLLHTHVTDLQQAKVEFIGGFVSLLDGEKDPRNLMVAFETVLFIIDKFDISQHIEDLFDVLFCYFPIGFNAPPNNPLEITTEDLKISLRRCLAATPYFANYATPLLMEKLITVTGSAKKDVIDTISLCAPVYGAHAFLPHTVELFDILVNEVCQTSDLSMETSVLGAIHSVVATLGTGISIANIRDPVEKSIDALLDQCVNKLKEPQLRYAKVSASILRAIASASDPACTSVVNLTCPLLQTMFENTSSIDRKSTLLSIFIEILQASKTLYGSIEDTDFDRDFQTPLLYYKQVLLDLFVSSLNRGESRENDLILMSLKGIRLMVVMKQFLSEQEMETIAIQLSRMIKKTSDEARTLLVSSLAVLAKLNLTYVKNHAFSQLFDMLPEHEKPTDKTYINTLDALKQLTITPFIFNTIVASQLLEKIDASLRVLDQTTDYVHDLLRTMLELFQKMAPKNSKTIQLGQHIFFPHIMAESIKSTLNYSNSWQLCTPLVDVVSLLMAAIVRHSIPSHQKSLLAIAFHLFVDGDMSSLNLEPADSTHFMLFSSTCISPPTIPSIDISLLFTAIVSNVQKDVILPTKSYSEFIKTLVQTILNTPNDKKRIALIKLFAVIINKWGNPELMELVSSVTTTYLDPAFESSNNCTKEVALSLTLWMAKALTIQGHSLGFQMVDRILSQCRSPELGHSAAIGFSTILQDDELLLNKQSHAVISILYKQRIFNYTTPKLIELAYVSFKNAKTNYFIALSYLLSGVPGSVVSDQISKFMPSIVDSIYLSNPELSLTMIKVISSIISISPGKIELHLSPCIDVLLHSSDSANGMISH
ncbi:RNAPII transcription regulator C-terminal-domain-containing protein [Spinellus fusiger]|nr:RNAPII transcription regulator C-terminal-domain-containing protein [Spinellus fusiger]